MKITPRKGFLLVSNQELEDEKKNVILLVKDDKKKNYLRVEMDSDNYKAGDCIFALPFKTKIQVDENLFIIDENDVVASFTI